VTLTERLGAAVYHQPMHDRMNFPFTHPLHAGMPAPRNAAVREALSPHDVVLVVGSHAFSPHHYTPEPPIPPGTTVVQLDDDPAELGRNFPVALGLTGGIRATLAELAGRVPAHPARQATTRPRARPSAGTAPLAPEVAAQTIAEALPPDAVLVDEAITIGVLLRPLLRLDRPDSFVHTAGGGLGWGIGAAVGSRLGAPDRPVVAVLGDGCAMFGLQGLWSAARYRVPVTFLVMNNGEYRTLKETLAESGSPGPHPGLDLALPGAPRLDWRHAARFFGVPGRRVESSEDLREVVAGAGALDGPLLVDVPIRNRKGS
jgi:benzoylformate decarboxylase